MEGLIFDIQRFSIHDGPGIRTTVFMKGCSLNCKWCHNPESINRKKEIQTYFHKCIGCGKCFEICPVGAHTVVDGEHIYNRKTCMQCGKCTNSCYSGSLVMTGKEKTAEEILEEVEKDILFYRNSGGGVTLSGGEPLLQSGFAARVLKLCKDKGINTAVDTAGNVPYSAFEEVIPYTDLFLFDIKIMNPTEHKKYTGADNIRIFRNLIKLDKTGIPIRVRIPIITGVNDEKIDFETTAEFLSKFKNIESVGLLPYHNLGAGKLESLGIDVLKTAFATPSVEKMNGLYEILYNRNIAVI